MTTLRTILIAAAVLVGSCALLVWSEVRQAKVIPEPVAQASGELAAERSSGS